MATKDGWSPRDVRRRCTELRAVLVDWPEVCTAEEIAEYWPGGAQNQIPGRGGWFYCYAQFSAMVRRAERVPKQDEAEDAAAEQATIDAYRDKPVNVALVFPIGEVRAVTVYPKAHDTVALVDDLNADIRWLLETAEFLRARPEGDAGRLAADAMREVRHLHLAICWIACHKPTPGHNAPFATAGPVPAALPSPYVDLDSFDVVNILQAYHTVHRLRMEAIGKLLHRLPAGGGPASWATLTTAAAGRFRCPAEHLLQERSLPAWYAQFVRALKAEHDAVPHAPGADMPPVTEEVA